MNGFKTLGGGACGCAACLGADDQSTALALPRRRFLAAGAALMTGGGAMLAARGARAEAGLAPDAAIARLMAGNDRFVSHALTSFDEDLRLLRQANAGGQEPFAAVLSCADSRVPVELVFDASIGQVFVTRVAGNIATSDIIASLEYGAAVLGVRAIVVMGHEGCGAVKAAIAGKAVPGQISTLYPDLRAAVNQAGPDVEATAKANARIQADLLSTASPVIAGMIKDGSLKVVAAYYALATGKVTLLS